MFTEKDLQQIAARGTDLRRIEEQIAHFKNGFPWMKIVAAATPGRGIRVLDEAAAQAAASYYQSAKVNGKCKFVPASGAASRMFKDQFAALERLEAGEDLPADAPGRKLAARIKDFAFYTPELFGEPEDSAEYRRQTLRKLLKDDPNVEIINVHGKGYKLVVPSLSMPAIEG